MDVFQINPEIWITKDSSEIKPWVQNFIPNIDEYNLCLISNIIFEMLQYVGMVANQDYDYDYDSVCKSFFNIIVTVELNLKQVI